MGTRELSLQKKHIQKAEKRGTKKETEAKKQMDSLTM